LSPVGTPRYAAAMTEVPSLNPRIVEALYTEALVLADAARSRFDDLRQAAGGSVQFARLVRTGPDGTSDSGPISDSGRNCGPDDVEVMCEALRTTTRVMHCLAWLLNHRAWFAGQISAVQLRRHGRLISHFPASDSMIVDRLPPDLAALVHQSERLYARIQRLEQAWRNDPPAQPGAIERLRERLRERLAHAALKQA
jgi:regulator of CtrA degradation